MTRVLLVEDDRNLSFILKSSLEQMIGGYRVMVAQNGREGLEWLDKEPFDVIVSDVEMPVMDGMTMVKHIRLHHPDLAIVFITGLTTARDVINGYQSGADFYIKKPFLPEELHAHIQAVLKIKPGASAPKALEEKCEEDGYDLGDYRFLPSQNLLVHASGRQPLTPKEAKILDMLCRNKGRIVNRDDILMAVWGTADFYTSRSLDVFVTKLRKYLSEDSRISLKALKGVGICLEEKD